MSKMTRRELLSFTTPAAIGSVLGAGVLAGAATKDMIDPVKRLKIVVFGAHPDDPETGCGGAMLEFSRAGHEVISAYLTRGEAGIEGKSYAEAANIRSREALEACKILGARPEFLGQIDGNCEINQKRYQHIFDFIQKEQPDLLFTHWPIDSHRDHRVCSLLVYDAWLRLGRQCPFYYYEVMTGSQSQNFYPTHYLDITTTAQEKHDASFKHVSQDVQAWYETDVERVQVFRGMEYGCKYAEAFIKHAQSPEVIFSKMTGSR